MNSELKTDRVFLEIFKNRVQAIVEEMANVVLRTGFTAFVKETGDFGTYLLSPQGETFGCPLDTGYNLSLGIPAGDVISSIGQWNEGDIVICNDPYSTGGMATHLPDVYLLKPFFYEGQIIAFGLCFIHSSDVGGKVPGSVSPSSYDIYQEGLRLAPVKLYEAGVLNEAILRIFLDNCRIPDQNWGDLRALMAALNRGERRLQELVERYGISRVESGIEDVLVYAETRVRQMIQDIPDGEYEFWDYIEKGPGGYPVRLRCKMVVRDDGIFLDFKGTDPQVRASFNIPTLNKQGHYYLVPALIRYFRTLDPSIPWNSGMVRMITNDTPSGTLLNPEAPAAIGARAATFIRLMDVLTGTLSQAQENKLPAAGAGQAAIVMLAMTDPVTGGRKVGVVQPICGGSGARPMKDGIDGMDFAVGHLRNIPAETVEADMPILIERYGLLPDSAGAGTYRGGCGIDLQLKVLSPDTVLTARNMERMEFQPWGRLGGKAGAYGTAVKNLGQPSEQRTGRIDELLLQPGDTVSFFSQGGGGYGSPYKRSPQAVARDVRNGLVSKDAAYEQYGVVFHESKVDLDATQKRRSAVYGSTDEQQSFHFGSAREQFESIWSDEMQLAVGAALTGYPLALRDYLKRCAMKEIDDRFQRGEQVQAIEVAEIMAAIHRTIAAL
ncbi:hydantoinase B/oxoprolinase family protein [Paenibacillus kribbensis]|uniref:hydantoinase B/oxoprolinase family protein n=1 Tax=Paenibacillus TaxID=44249 RepID=UPI00024EF7A9|nr:MULTISPECIES: hydantoinase B/oxoprolinase family protein [Paenibacillus]EHS55647.1 hydantoin utilization protein B [Paenibacillus sp. Aloe-11]MEC0235986.1 hydantoinase B/oxoprolinase family protein [Paenibacillus kribbensis]